MTFKITYIYIPGSSGILTRPASRILRSNSSSEMTKSLGAGAIKSLICFTSPESPPDTCFNSKTFNFFMTTSPKFNYKKVDRYLRPTSRPTSRSNSRTEGTRAPSESPPDTCFNSKTFNFFMTTSPKFNDKKVFEIRSFEILRMWTSLVESFYSNQSLF